MSLRCLLNTGWTVHSHVILIHIQFKFHDVLVIGYLVMVNFMDCYQFKGYNSYITEASLVKLTVHQRLVVIYIYY